MSRSASSLGAVLDLATGPAAVAVVARRERERQRQVGERIATDLHDHVLLRLFAAALNLHRVVGDMGPGPVAAQLEVTVDGLDDTIFQLRRMIDRMRETAPVGDGAAQEVLVALHEALTSDADDAEQCSAEVGDPRPRTG